MAPKKKSRSSKGTKGSSGIIDGVSISEMSREQLESFVLRIQQELEREREERNFFQLDRDKIRTFWEITRQHLEEYRARLKNKDKELEEAEENHEKCIEVSQQKIKHLMYEQHSKISLMKVENIVELRCAELDFAERESHLLDDKRYLKSKMAEEEEAHLCQLRTYMMETDEKILKILSDNENCRAIECKYQTYIENLKANLDFKNEIEICEIEERKNNHIKRLTESHDKKYEDIVHFYTDVTAKILALVSILKERLIKSKKEKCQMMHQLQEFRTQNQKLTSPLKMAKDHIFHMQRIISTQERNLKRIKISERQLNELRLKNENLQHSYDRLTFSNDEQHKKYEITKNQLIEEVFDLQQNITYQNGLLEQKLMQLKKEFETRMKRLVDSSTRNDERETIDILNLRTLMTEMNDKMSSIITDIFEMLRSNFLLGINHKP